MDSLHDAEFEFKIINDPIYGCIGLSESEVKLLDTRAMQRLRRIRQMGFASYVFPSGEHSRFVHSLGVLCIMSKMCKHLYNKYGSSKENGISFSVKDVQKLRIAALLHDVGHFPFSHLSECVYSFIENENSTDKMLGISSEYPCLLSDIANYKKHKKKDHEHLGAEVIKTDPEIRGILENMGIDPVEIGNIIIGDVQAKPIYAQLLHSSLDADRLDYLLRDSRQAGVSFGNVELEYIIRQMRIEKLSLQGGNELEWIVFDIRGQHAIEHFLMARYFHYSQVVQHKTSSAFEAVAKALEYKVLKGSETPYKDYNSIVKLIGQEEFYIFNDDYMWQLINNYAKKTQDEYVKSLWDCLNKRKKPINVLTMTDIIHKKNANLQDTAVNSSVYFLTKWLIKNKQEYLAKKSKIGEDQVKSYMIIGRLLIMMNMKNF